MMDDATPFVSVIIPVLNGERTIGDCVTSLLRMDYPQERREILVVDNGSTDRTAEIVKSFPVRYLREERRGVSHARNRGIEASQGDILAFTDADNLVTTGWLRELVRGFDSDAVGVVVGETVSYPPNTPAERYMAMRKPLWQKRVISYPVFPWFSSCNVAFRRNVFNQIGLFDPWFPAANCEDLDLSWRFFQCKSFKMNYRPKALGFHCNYARVWDLFKQNQRYGYGQALLCRKYPGKSLWGWRRELGAYRDLFLAALAFGRAGLLSIVKGQEATRFSYLYCELVRKLGARIGFIRGTMRRDTRYG